MNPSDMFTYQFGKRHKRGNATTRALTGAGGILRRLMATLFDFPRAIHSSQGMKGWDSRLPCPEFCANLPLMKDVTSTPSHSSRLCKPIGVQSWGQLKEIRRRSACIRASFGHLFLVLSCPSFLGRFQRERRCCILVS